MTDPFVALEASDPAIADVVRRERERQNTTIQLIASENFTSPAVLAAQGSVLTNKYSEGYPGKRYYGGNAVVDEAEELARTRARDLFGAEHVNVQPHSGANANMAAYMALLEPGDVVMGMRLDQGGHLTHGSPVNFSGRLYHFVAYGVDDATETLDYDAIAAVARAERPKLIVAGARVSGPGEIGGPARSGKVSSAPSFSSAPFSSTRRLRRSVELRVWRRAPMGRIAVRVAALSVLRRSSATPPGSPRRQCA